MTNEISRNGGERQNYVLRKLLMALTEVVNEKHLTYQEIVDQAKLRFGIEISPYQIRSVANGKFQENKVIPTLDTYIDTILKVVGMTDIDFLNRAVAYVNSNLTDGAKVVQYNHLSEELKKFVDNLKYFLKNTCI